MSGGTMCGRGGEAETDSDRQREGENAWKRRKMCKSSRPKKRARKKERARAGRTGWRGVYSRDMGRGNSREGGGDRLARRVLGSSYSATAPASITSTRSESTTVDSLRDGAS
jgi:hypothetical protein